MIGLILNFIPYFVWAIFTSSKGIETTGNNSDIFWVGLVCIIAVDLISYLRERAKHT